MANHNPPVNGLDKRPTAINRKGRPKSFDAWRKLLVDISNEPAVQRDKDNNVKRLVRILIPLVIDGKPVTDDDGSPVMVEHYATNAEMIARSWIGDPKRQQAFIEGAFGKVPDELAVKTKGKVTLVVKYADKEPDDKSS